MTSDTAPGGVIKAQEVMDSELKDTIQGWGGGGEEMAVLWTEKRRRSFLHQTPSHCDTRSGRHTGASGPAGEWKPRLGVVAKQPFTIQSENCPTSGLRCATMSLCCISTVAQKGQAGLYLLNLWDATKSNTSNLSVKWNFYKKNICFKIPNPVIISDPVHSSTEGAQVSRYRGWHCEPSWPLVHWWVHVPSPFHTSGRRSHQQGAHSRGSPAEDAFWWSFNILSNYISNSKFTTPNLSSLKKR